MNKQIDGFDLFIPRLLKLESNSTKPEPHSKYSTNVHLEHCSIWLKTLLMLSHLFPALKNISKFYYYFTISD